MENGLRGYAEYGVYLFSFFSFAASSVFLGMNILLLGLSFASLAIALFKRSNVLSFAALFAYAAAVGIAKIGFSPMNIAVFGFFSLLPFFACFRLAGSKARGTIPWEAAAVLVPVLIALLLSLFGGDAMPMLASEQALMPEWILALSLGALLAVLLAIPLAAEAANLFKPPAE